MYTVATHCVNITHLCTLYIDVYSGGYRGAAMVSMETPLKIPHAQINLWLIVWIIKSPRVIHSVYFLYW